MPFIDNKGEAIQQLKDKADREAVDVKGDDGTNALRDEIKKLLHEMIDTIF